jgi:cytochrome c oxidase cbb3-type subunit 3
MKRIVLFFSLLLGGAGVAEAQTAAPASADNSLMLFYVVVGFVFITALLVLAVATYMLQVLNVLAKREEVAKAEATGKVYQPEPSLWARFWQYINDFTPVEKEAAVVLDHNYDGIRELDNHLPPWWKWLLYGTIVWSVFYLVAYHVTDTLPLSDAEYDNEVALANEQVKKLKAASPAVEIDENNVPLSMDAALLADGKKTFLGTCASCHRPDGGGDIGPNLTDEYWKHGGGINEIYKVVKNGVTGTNMIAWGASMSPQAMVNVSNYVLSLQGTNPANPKKPEGELVKPTAPAVADSTKTQALLR